MLRISSAHSTLKARSRIFVLLLACFMTSCGNDISKIQFFEPKELPESTIENARMRRSEEGRLQVIMEAPLVLQYSKPAPKTDYPKGIKMRFFNGYNNPTGTLTARYAVQYSHRQQTIVRDSVVIVDLRNGDTVYLQELTWDEMVHRVYSNKPVRTKNGPRITLGDRFESDDAFTQPRIFHQRGTLEWKEE